MNYKNAVDGVAPIANKLGAFLAAPSEPPSSFVYEASHAENVWAPRQVHAGHVFARKWTGDTEGGICHFRAFGRHQT